MTTTLSALQKAFHDYLQGNSSAIEEKIMGKNAADVKRRLKIYQEAYQLRLLENLQKQYPVLYKWLGEKNFSDLSAAYEKTYTPDDVIMRRYGALLSTLLMKQDEIFLSELARFEWAINEVLDEAPDVSLLSLTEIQRLSTEALLKATFSLQPALQCLSFDYPVPDFWQQCTKRRPRKIPLPSESPTDWIIWRKNLCPYYCRILPLEKKLLQALDTGINFEGLCDTAAQEIPEEEAANTVAQMLMRWLSNGWLTSRG